MSNKTSDKNVGSIEEDIKELKRLLYSDTLTQYGKRKLVNYYEQRIQELKEESRKKSIELICYQKELENSIPTQVVIDKMEELRNDIKLGNCRYPYILRHKIQVLQELLGGRANEF